jgi:hypothetical protein
MLDMFQQAYDAEAAPQAPYEERQNGVSPRMLKSWKLT